MAASELDDIGHDIDRIKALSDGVFAISLTLLVLNLKAPDLDPDQGSRVLALQLRDQIPIIGSYVIAFYILGLNWIVHTRVIRHLVGYDRTILFQNLFVLLFVALMPYGASLYGQFSLGAMHGDSGTAQLSWTIYASIAAILGVCQASLWRTAIKKKMVDERVTPRLASYISARIWVTVLTVVASIGVAGFAPVVIASAMPALTPLLLKWLHSHYEKMQ